MMLNLEFEDDGEDEEFQEQHLEVIDDKVNEEQ